MLDLEGKELERGAVYYILGSGSRIVVARFSHETDESFVFKSIKNIARPDREPILFTWKRVITKWCYPSDTYKSIQVIRVSQEVLDRYAIT